MNLAIRGFNANLGQEAADTFARDQFLDQKVAAHALEAAT